MLAQSSGPRVLNCHESLSGCVLCCSYTAFGAKHKLVQVALKSCRCCRTPGWGETRNACSGFFLCVFVPLSDCLCLGARLPMILPLVWSSFKSIILINCIPIKCILIHLRKVCQISQASYLSEVQGCFNGLVIYRSFRAMAETALNPKQISLRRKKKLYFVVSCILNV